MNTTDSTLTRFLLPLDTEGPFVQPAALMGCLAKTLDQRIEKVTLIHVMAGRYLSQHMTNIDFRIDHIVSSDKFQDIRNVYIDREIKPILETAKRDLESSGVKAPIEIVIEDGDPVEHIVNRVNRENYSSLVLQRSSTSQVRDMFVGSVTSGVLHREVTGSIYLTGSKAPGDGCPPKALLIALDGSDNAQAALGEAAILIAGCGDTVEKVLLVHVLDLAECGEALDGGKVPKQPTDDLLDKAADLLERHGLANNKIVKISCCGDPADILVDEANRQEIDMIFMGRRDRTVLKELFMGSVSRKIIYRCFKQTVVLVSAD